MAWPKSSDSSSVSGTAPQLMATKGPAVRGRLVVDQARDALLADAALAGDEHRRVHLGDAARQIEHPLHRRRSARRGRRLGTPAVGVGPSAWRRVRSVRSTRLSSLGHLRQRGIQAGLLVERQVSGDGLAPLVDRTADHAAHGVALAAAALLQAVDLAAVGAREVAAGEAGQRPAHRLVGAAEVQQVLLGLVAVVPDRERDRLRRPAPGPRRPARRAPAPAACAASRRPASTPRRCPTGSRARGSRRCASRGRSRTA